MRRPGTRASSWLTTAANCLGEVVLADGATVVESQATEGRSGAPERKVFPAAERWSCSDQERPRINVTQFTCSASKLPIPATGGMRHASPQGRGLRRLCQWGTA